MLKAFANSLALGLTFPQSPPQPQTNGHMIHQLEPHVHGEPSWWRGEELVLKSFEVIGD
jgi:hypothetical protein